MNLTVITPPAYEPVALADAWAHLRLTASGSPLEHPDDDMLTRYIATARREVEHITGRSLVRQRVRLSASGFSRLVLLRPPLISVESVQYYDTARVLQTMAASDWYTTDDLVPELCIIDTAAWPVTSARQDAVRVTYWTGYAGDSSPDTEREEQIANVPKEAIDGILMGLSLLYEAMTPEQRENMERARKAVLDGITLRVLA